MKKFLKWFSISLLVICLILFVSFRIYVSDYYKADLPDKNTAGVTIETHENLTIIAPESNGKNIGFVFYPGGKVQAESYIPLLSKIASQGITSVIVEMPYNLAVLNPSGGKKAVSYLSDVSTWYLGGHSLGGAMASNYYNKTKDVFSGLILMGAYPVGDISPNEVLITYGSNDNVLNKSKLPVWDRLGVINGGNHSYFGNYGEQKGDGNATISREEQQDIAAEKVLNFIDEREKINN